LLHAKSASIDAEKSMISKLKAECGSQFTQHLEGMFKDIDLSREIMQSFRQTFDDEALTKGIEMNVNVITQGCWPSYPVIDVNIPEQLAVLQEKFQDFYLGKHSGRQLTWQNSQGHCVLKARFGSGMKELSVSLFQCVVLMLFNDAEKLSYEDIASKSGLEEKELKRALQSLACAKVRILNKEPKSRDVNAGDVFEVNAALNERLFRIKVNSIQIKETTEENKQTMERVFQDRQQQVDAAIVRVMKTRKSLTHALLISELMAQLKFPTKASDLKKRIESLIEREYIERDREDAQKYNYLA
jgi:cullin-4